MRKFNRVVFSVWFVSVRIPLIIPRVSWAPRNIDFARSNVALGAAALMLAGVMTPGIAEAGKAFHPGAVIPSLAARQLPAGPFGATAMSIAPILQSTGGEWYNQLGHAPLRPERVAKLEPRTDAALSVAQLADQKPEAAPPVAGLAALAPKQASAATILAFADPSPKSEGGALAAIRSIDQTAGAIEGGIDLGALEIDDVPVPIARPQREEAVAPPADKAVASLPPPDKPAPPLPRAVPAAPADAPPSAAKTPPGGFLNKLFGGGRPRAGNKVAVYDISAAKVYMPDGSVLEAHSGIGKMADNPRYVHVKMNGPTPPQTYDLKMRESRFHGVEAVRMTPVGNQTMHGRDGMLTHSYLLRGRPGQSHGCVAFKEYHKFLSAFKKGHVKRIIVVPGGGAGVFARANSRPGDDA